ncbi:hypothetical protein BH23GEM4_BH23GEM4_23500 [soil metagenome]
MHGSFLLESGAILGALALSALLFLRFRQSVIPAYILLGMALRPLVEQSRAIEELATLGVVLLLFFMGLEFSLGALLRDRRRIVRTGGIDLLLCFPVGLIAGWALGFGWAGTLLLAGAVYMSSSAIIAKSVIELRRSADPETALALGILVFEDLFIALFLAILSGAVLVEEPDALAAAWGVGRALLFFGLVVLVALRARPLLDRAFAVESDDVFVLLVGSVTLLLSWGALAAGLSEAIGAFLAGLALAETAHKARAERLFAPLQGIFAAIFFLGFGLSIDPAEFRGIWPAALLLAVGAVVSKIAAGWWAGRGSGLSRRGALALGLTLIARGEFSIILAGIAVTIGLPELGATIALLVLLLSVVGTSAMQFSPQIGRRIFPRRRERTLAEQGFSPELARFPTGGAEEPAERAERLPSAPGSPPGTEIAPLARDTSTHSSRGDHMGGKKMGGSEEQKRQAARDAREAGKDPSEVGATTGASKQRTKASKNMSHQEKVDLKREGKQDVIAGNTPEARPGSRDEDTPDRERFPRE